MGRIAPSGPLSPEDAQRHLYSLPFRDKTLLTTRICKHKILKSQIMIGGNYFAQRNIAAVWVNYVRSRRSGLLYNFNFNFVNIDKPLLWKNDFGRSPVEVFRLTKTINFVYHSNLYHWFIFHSDYRSAH